MNTIKWYASWWCTFSAPDCQLSSFMALIKWDCRRTMTMTAATTTTTTTTQDARKKVNYLKYKNDEETKRNAKENKMLIFISGWRRIYSSHKTLAICKNGVFGCLTMIAMCLTLSYALFPFILFCITFSFRNQISWPCVLCNLMFDTCDVCWRFFFCSLCRILGDTWGVHVKCFHFNSHHIHEMFTSHSVYHKRFHILTLSLSRHN